MMRYGLGFCSPFPQFLPPFFSLACACPGDSYCLCRLWCIFRAEKPLRSQFWLCLAGGLLCGVASMNHTCAPTQSTAQLLSLRLAAHEEKTLTLGVFRSRAVAVAVEQVQDSGYSGAEGSDEDWELRPPLGKCTHWLEPRYKKE